MVQIPHRMQLHTFKGEEMGGRQEGRKEIGNNYRLGCPVLSNKSKMFRTPEKTNTLRGPKELWREQTR